MNKRHFKLLNVCSIMCQHKTNIKVITPYLPVPPQYPGLSPEPQQIRESCLGCAGPQALKCSRLEERLSCCLLERIGGTAQGSLQHPTLTTCIVSPLMMLGWDPMIAHTLPAFSSSFSFQYLIAFGAQVSEASFLNRISSLLFFSCRNNPCLRQTLPSDPVTV